MRKYILVLLSVLLFTTASVAQEKKEVIIFSQPTCYFCKLMNTELESGIKAANPNVKFTILDVYDTEDRKILNSLAIKHNIKGDIVTPLIFVGKNHMMGWGEDAGKQLQKYIDEMN